MRCRPLPSMVVMLVATATIAGAEDGDPAGVDVFGDQRGTAGSAPEDDLSGWTDPWPVPGGSSGPAPAAPAVTPTVTTGLRPDGPITPIGPAARPVSPQNRLVPPIGGPVLPDPEREVGDRSAYDPVGLRIGAWRLDAAATAGVGSSSDDGAFWSAGGDLRLASEWDRHAAALSLRGGVQSFLDGAPDDPAFDARIDGVVDLTETDRIGLGAGWSLSREDDSDPDVLVGQPETDVHVLSATIGYERRAGLIGLDLRGAVDRELYTDDAGRDDVVASATLRLSLENGAILRPFVEASLFTRRPDEDTDAAGYRRAGNGVELKGGLAIDGDRLDGEVALGWVTESFEDDRLETIGSLVVEADLAYAVTPLVTATLAADTLLDSTSVPGASGSVTHEVEAGIAYALRPNILLDAGAGFSYEAYVGTDLVVRTTTVSAGAAWALNPALVLSLEAEQSFSEETGATDDRETSISAAVTVRR